MGLDGRTGNALALDGRDLGARLPSSDGRRRAEALDGPDLLYISIDIDSLDPAYAPATGTPEPGGIVAADLLRMVRKLAYEHNVVGMDVVEVAPAYDHADCTVNVANRLFMECLAGMAAKRRDAAGGGTPGLPAK